MTSPFLTTAQREFLLEEYEEQLDEFGLEAQEISERTEWLHHLNNVEFLNECIEQMPIYGEPVGREILEAMKQ